MRLSVSVSVFASATASISGSRDISQIRAAFFFVVVASPSFFVPASCVAVCLFVGWLCGCLLFLFVHASCAVSEADCVCFELGNSFAR